MRKKLTNTRVINSIGIGILAMVTASTPVLAEINDTVNDNNSAADTNASDIPAEPVEQPAPTQNEQILQMLSDAQSTIQEVQSSLQQTPEGELPDTEGANLSEEMLSAETAGMQEEAGASEGSLETKAETPSAPENTESLAEDSQIPTGTEGEDTTDDSRSPEAEETPGTETVTPLADEGTENPPVDEGIGNEDNDDASQGTDVETPETVIPAINECLEESQEALGGLKNSFTELQEKNQEAQEAVKNYNEAVENPHNFIDSIAEIISNASSAVVGTVTSVTEEEATAREQAQAAVDAQAKVYEDQEAAAAAQQQAQAAAAAAEEAYKAAQSAVENAAANKQIADDRLADLENQLSNADAAVRDMEIKVQTAQEMLISILEQYGLTLGEFNPDELKGEAETAYKNAEQAVMLAQSELDSVRSNYNALIEQVEAAKNEYAETVNTLNDSTASMDAAVSDLEAKRQEWEDSNFDLKIAEYNEGLIGTKKVYLALEDTKTAFDKANEALSKAEDIKSKADKVLANAQNAVDQAKKEETEMSDAAEKAAAAAKEADLTNEKDVEEAKAAAEEAEKAAKAAAAKVERNLVVLDSAEMTAEQAQEELEAAKQAVEAAAKAKDTAQEAYDKALEDWEKVQNDALEQQIEAVKKAMEPLENLKEDQTLDKLAGTLKYALAKELIEYQLLCEGKEIKAIRAGAAKNEIIVTDPEDKETIYYISTRDNPFAVYPKEGGTAAKPFISIDKFKESMEEITAQKENLDLAQKKLENLTKSYTEAVQGQNKAEVVKVLVDMRDALTNVEEEAKNLVESETAYRTSNTDNKILDALSSALTNLADGGEKLNSAKNTLEAVETAQNEVKDAIDRLTEFTVQEKADLEAYEDLQKAYEKASTDHAAAVEALKQCVSGLNRVQTQKDRARIAADAIFEYLSGGNEEPTTPSNPGTTEPTTPTQPGNNNGTDDNTPSNTTPVQPVAPIEPIYGTLIDSVTSSAMENAGGTSGTGYAGYTYTIGGQPAYTVGETTAPEEEAADELVNVEDSAVPLAAVGENSKSKTTSTKNTRAVSDEKIPLDDMKTENNKASWWWILVIALLGATGTEMYIRHKEKTEQERKSKTGKQSYAKI